MYRVAWFFFSNLILNNILENLGLNIMLFKQDSRPMDSGNPLQHKGSSTGGHGLSTFVLQSQQLCYLR